MSHGTSKRKLAPLCLGQDQKIEPDDYHITVAKCTAVLLPVGFSFSVGKFKRISSQRLYDSTNRHIWDGKMSHLIFRMQAWWQYLSGIFFPPQYKEAVFKKSGRSDVHNVVSEPIFFFLQVKKRWSNLSIPINFNQNYSGPVPTASQIRLKSYFENAVVCLRFDKSFLDSLNQRN